MGKGVCQKQWNKVQGLGIKLGVTIEGQSRTVIKIGYMGSGAKLADLN